MQSGPVGLRSHAEVALHHDLVIRREFRRVALEADVAVAEDVTPIGDSEHHLDVLLDDQQTLRLRHQRPSQREHLLFATGEQSGLAGAERS